LKQFLDLKKYIKTFWRVLWNLTISSSLLKKPIDIHIPRENMLSDIVERTQVRLKGSSQIR